jgi:hypothetical protein
VTAVGVATVAPFEQIRCGEDEVRALVIKIFWSELWRVVFSRLLLVGLEWL